jgi:hypothetical protein
MGKPKKKKKKKRHVSHHGLAIYIKKVFYGKRRIMKIQIFQHAKNIIFKKSSNRNPKSFKIS